MAGGGGGTEPNLTPFIDLFSVLICFLLMTAAWIQLEAMPTSIEKATAKDSAPSDPPPPPPKDEKKAKLEVSLFPDKIILKENEKETVISKSTEIDSTSMKATLAEWRGRYPDKKDLVLNSEADVIYGDLIKVYDLLVASDWPDVGINPQ